VRNVIRKAALKVFGGDREVEEILRMSFDSNGFLGKQIDENRMDFVQKHQDLFVFLEGLNQFAVEIKDKFVIRNQNPRELIIGALYIKVLQSFESIIILSQRGLESDAKSILRVMLEAAFHLKAICIDEEFYKDYIKGDDYEKFKLYNRVSKDDNGIFSSEIKKLVTNEKIDNLKKTVWRRQENPLEIYKVAQRALMYDFYQLVYGTMSADVHTSVRSIEKFYGLNDDGMVEYLYFAPQYNEIEIAVILTACSVLNIILSSTCSFFNFNYPEFEENNKKLGIFEKKYCNEEPPIV
jgi:hypothetical protein